MSLSRITMSCCCVIGLSLWLVVACTAPISEQATPSGPNVRLYTRTPVPTVTPTPTVHPQVIYQQGLAQRRIWDLERALDRFDEALGIAPSALAYASRAEVYRLMEGYEEAATDIERALTLNPELAEAWRQKALLDHARAEWGEALVAVDKLIELKPEDGAAYVLRARINAEGLGKFDQALADYERAIELAPIFEKATLVERWHVLAKLERWEEALRVGRKMLIVGSQDPLRYYFRGWSLIQLGQIDPAIQVLFWGIERYPDYPVALYYALGVAYYERQAWLNAIQALEVALLQSGAPSSENTLLSALDITDADILGRIGVAYLELKQCETGAAIAERAIAESVDGAAWGWVIERIEACYLSLTPTPIPDSTPTP